jgi:hypothetical protein
VAGKTFTGQGLVDALGAGEFDHPPGVVLTGMVKPSELEDHVAFARGGCETWIDLPTSLIEQAEHVGSRPCKDHAHPVFRITLRESEDPQATLLARLLAAGPEPRLRQLPPGFGAPAPHRRAAAARFGLGLHDPCLHMCDWLVRECIGFGGDYDTCIGLRATCSDICGIISVFDPIFE